MNWINSVDRSESEKIALRYRDAIATVAFKLFAKDISSLTYIEQITYFDNALRHQLNQQKILNDEQAELIISLTEKVKGALVESDSEAGSDVLTGDLTDDVVEQQIVTDLNRIAMGADVETQTSSIEE